MPDFLSDSIAKTSKDRRNVKNQFGGAADVDEYDLLKIENVVVKSANLVVTRAGVEVVRRRWQWKTTVDFKKGSKSANMRWDNNFLQVG